MVHRQPIRKLDSDKQVPPRIFDILVDDQSGEVYVETKKDHNHAEITRWEDVKYQVDTAIRRYLSQTNT